MPGYQLKKGLRAAAWLRDILCPRRSPYAAASAEDIVALTTLRTSKNPYRASNLSTQSTLPAHYTSNPCAEQNIVKRHLHMAECLTSKRNFHITCAGNRPSRICGHGKSSSSSSSMLVKPSANVFLGYRMYSSGELQSFQRRRFGSGQWSTRQYVLIGVATTGLCISVYLSNREVVPYTYRKHFILIPPDFEMQMVQNQFKTLKEQWKHEILPPYHPQAIRVRKIAKDIIRAVLEGVQLEDSHALELEHGGRVRSPKQGDIDVLVWRGNADFPVSAQWGSKEEVLDDRWMDESRRKGLQQGSKPYVEHLKNTKWEVLIVDKDIVNAFCLPGGKIVVFTGLLKRFPNDKEIATVLGHEVAHVVARHSAERMTRHLYVTLIQLFLLAFLYAPDIVQSISVLFLELPFSRRQELEADHIGLLLMAAAGYDPRAAPSVYEKLGELGGTSAELLQYVTTHPSGKKRGERLKNTGTMEEAMKIYAERAQGTVMEGFLRAF